ncbi:EGFR-like protein [Mya arenaria]|uniref:EGFR-like protein n=1 Tax=Mya arenaria TaxID=6604 RepID=A0ABY7F375_MYAAR|nr:epidermal growth factor receptor-like [Mya arenaria]XP_052760639.1 epidermal growth factor receptor-like [Mya arenaria]WAR14305.1 EGFR-like protein [Mya arenaria]WAR15276.1 EGFR-like protein [Mya arenaria]
MEIQIVCAIFLTTTVWFENVLSFPMSSIWCPLGRYPAEGGQCKICYENCGEEGCSGPGSHLGQGGCNSCWLGIQRHRGQVQCMSPFKACPDGFYRKSTSHNGQPVTVCTPCHPLCKTCSGAGISSCLSCRFFRWDGLCVRACPLGSVIRHGSVRTCMITGATYTGRSSSRNSFYLVPYRDRFRQGP